MLRKLIDYKKLNHELAALLIETYPDGYGDEDIIVFRNAHGEYIEAVEIKTDEVLYLVKISKSLSDFISNFDDNMEKGLESTDKRILEQVDADKAEQKFNTDQENTDDYDLE